MPSLLVTPMEVFHVVPVGKRLKPLSRTTERLDRITSKAQPRNSRKARHSELLSVHMNTAVPQQRVDFKLAQKIRKFSVVLHSIPSPGYVTVHSAIVWKATFFFSTDSMYETTQVSLLFDVLFMIFHHIYAGWNFTCRPFPSVIIVKIWDKSILTNCKL